jgi:hypothetical protein
VKRKCPAAFPPGSLMPFCPVMPPDVTSSGVEDAALGLLGLAGMAAVRAADLASPCRRGLGADGQIALVAAGTGRIRSGDLVVWLKPVAIARAVVRRDGRVQAAGHPADHARLGVAEQRLDELTGRPGVIDEIARSVTLGGRVKGAARRAMTPALAIRFTLLMTLTPDADYVEVLEALLGDLVLFPWQRPRPGANRGGGLHLAGGARPGAAGTAAGPRAGRGRRRAPQPRLPRRHRGRPGGRLDRRVADPRA